MNENFPPELKQEFVIEAREHLEKSELALMQLDQNRSSREPVHELFRSIHTIKGSSSYLEIHPLKDLAHAFESLLDRLRHSESIVIDDAMLDAGFAVLDQLRRQVSAFADDQSVPPGESLIARLGDLGKATAEEAASSRDELPARMAPLTADQVFQNTVQQQMGALAHCLTAYADSRAFTEEHLQILVRTLGTLRAAHDFMGDADRTAELSLLMEHVESAGSEGAPALVQALQKLMDSLEAGAPAQAPVPVEVRSPAAPEVAVAPEVASTPDAPKEDRTLRVDHVYIDRLMNLVGELVIAKNALEHTQFALERGELSATTSQRELRTATARVAHLSSELQHAVRQVRLIPARTVFQRFGRVVRDLNRQTGKRLALVLEGEETQVDKKIAEQIAEPLLHVIRNAADHGIETPEQRIAVGKPPEGRLLIRASQQGQSVIIEVQDDGRGVDRDAVKRKAVERGLLSATEAEALTDEQTLSLLFRPGFSTASAVTELSGRGVGMDVVKTNLTKVNGKVSIRSERGVGTTISLEVPLTTAVLESILLESRSQIYAMPIQNVLEVLKVSVQEVKSLMHSRTICLRGEIVPILDLASIVSRGRGAIEELLRISVVVIQHGSQKLGLVVESIRKTEEVVVKPLPDGLGRLPGVSGVSVLGDGRAILILDPAELILSRTADRTPAITQRVS